MSAAAVPALAQQQGVYNGMLKNGYPISLTVSPERDGSLEVSAICITYVNTGCKPGPNDLFATACWEPQQPITDGATTVLYSGQQFYFAGDLKFHGSSARGSVTSDLPSFAYSKDKPDKSVFCHVPQQGFSATIGAPSGIRPPSGTAHAIN